MPADIPDSTHLRPQIVLTHDVDQSELGLEPIDVYFLALRNVLEELAVDVVLDGPAVTNGLLTQGASQLQLQVEPEHLGHILPDEKLADVLQVRYPFEERVRSISCSACFISTTDSFRSCRSRMRIIIV
jgi:hypothetical protein